MELPILLLVLIGGMWLMSIFARKQQKKMADEQARRTEEAMVPGTWVRTTSGFYGTVVEVDGEVVTLATPLGDETLWSKRAIVGAEEPPFASALDQDEETADEEGQDLVEDREAIGQAAEETADKAQVEEPAAPEADEETADKA